MAWKFIRNMVGNGVVQSFPLSQNGGNLINDLSKAEPLTEFYLTIFGTAMHNPDESRLINYVNFCLEETLHDPINNDSTLKELQVQKYLIA